ncbi:hypothetical protein A0H81_09404 [Grifola frondosa]|uniref:Zn(2)-C6 fungal-type domain-containing protein n=1 Tax=Grifola frondosa TaxID=5627 RepID=A0A1C7M2A2_GRIFR|nr:hypothetical protein A0H81_09404 [Grifola frondosa]
MPITSDLDSDSDYLGTPVDPPHQYLSYVAHNSASHGFMHSSPEGVFIHNADGATPAYNPNAHNPYEARYDGVAQEKFTPVNDAYHLEIEEGLDSAPVYHPVSENWGRSNCFLTHPNADPPVAQWNARNAASSYAREAYTEQTLYGLPPPDHSMYEADLPPYPPSNLPLLEYPCNGQGCCDPDCGHDGIDHVSMHAHSPSTSGDTFHNDVECTTHGITSTSDTGLQGSGRSYPQYSATAAVCSAPVSRTPHKSREYALSGALTYSSDVAYSGGIHCYHEQDYSMNEAAYAGPNQQPQCYPLSDDAAYDRPRSGGYFQGASEYSSAGMQGQYPERSLRRQLTVRMHQPPSCPYVYPRFDEPQTGSGHPSPSSYSPPPFIHAPRPQLVANVNTLHDCTTSVADDSPSMRVPAYPVLSIPHATPGPLQPPLPTLVEDTPKKPLTLACFFCRKRKIACQSPPPGSIDRTCNQCARRNLKCEYPVVSRRGIRPRNYDANDEAGLHSTPAP